MKKGRARFIRLPALDRERSLHEQLRRHLRELIATGAIAAGARMPAQRALARDLGVSRNTVSSAYDALISDGLLEGRTGAGTFVVAPRPPTRRRKPLSLPQDVQAPLPFEPGAIAAELFPSQAWRKIQDARWRTSRAADMAYGHEAGWSGLRYIMAQRLAATRGLMCSPEQVLILTGVGAALRLAVMALCEPGDQAWVEDLCEPTAPHVLQTSGVNVLRGQLDRDGLDVADCRSRAATARLIHLTPASQFPTGAALSPERRSALIDWVRRSGGWIVENDSDSDFYFDHAPAPPLAAQAPDRVIYMASFDNVLLPSLQVTVMVVPEALVDRVLAVRRLAREAGNIGLHMTLHDFMDGGHLAAHIRRCRDAYGERRAVLREALERRLGGHLRLARRHIGLHVTAWLETDYPEIGAHAAAEGLTVRSLSSYGEAANAGLVLGFGGFSPAAIKSAVEHLSRLMEKERSAARP